MDQNTPEWLEFRKNKIGGSDAPIIMGSSPFKTPYKLWREKLCLDDNNIETNAMTRGKLLEPIAREQLSRQLDIELLPTVRNSRTVDYIMASLDAQSSDGKIIVEIKCPTTPREKAVPDIYFPQLQHQLYVCELDKMYYYNYFEGHSFLLEVYRDDDFINEMLAKEAEFWDCMQSLTPPKLLENDYIEREDELWCKAALHFKQVSVKRKELEKEESHMRDYLIQLAQGCNSKGNGVTLSKVVRKGNIDYSSIEVLKNVDLEKYRKPNMETWRLA